MKNKCWLVTVLVVSFLCFPAIAQQDTAAAPTAEEQKKWGELSLAGKTFLLQSLLLDLREYVGEAGEQKLIASIKGYIFEGIGIRIDAKTKKTRDGVQIHPFIRAVYPETPASAAGLREEDEIRLVNGKAPCEWVNESANRSKDDFPGYEDWCIRDTVIEISARAFNEVSLNIVRKGQPLKFNLTKSKIGREPVSIAFANLDKWSPQIQKNRDSWNNLARELKSPTEGEIDGLFARFLALTIDIKRPWKKLEELTELPK